MSSKPVDPRKRALQMNAGSQISSILHPLKPGPVKGAKVVNHSANNRQALKAAQVRNQLRREEEEAKAAEAPFKMARFKAVESVLRQKSHEGTLGRPLAPGERASSSRGLGATGPNSRRTASGGGISAKMGGLNLGGGGVDRQRFDDEEEEENVYAAPRRGGADRAPQYDDDAGQDDGQDWRGEEEGGAEGGSYEDGGRFDDDAEQEYSRQQYQAQPQTQGRGRPQQQQQHYDEDDESINTLVNNSRQQQQQQQQQYGAAPASGAPRGISSMQFNNTNSNHQSGSGMRGPVGQQSGYDREGGGQRSFISENAKKVIQSSRALASSRAGGGGADDAASEYGGPSAGAGSNIQKHGDYGRVPQYIREQQAAMAQAKAAADAAKKEKDLGIPPGMVLMPEEQRLNTLAVLQENHKKVLYDISCFPLRVETISRKKAKAELEAKLEEIEKALQLFSRKRVLIQP